MAGLGEFALGVTPFGLGTPDSTQAPPDTLPTGSRFLNFRTKDYEVASNGELRRMPSVRHRVLMALSTTQGSSTVLPEFGLKLPERIDKRYNQLAEQAIRAALKPLVRAQDIRILFVRVNRTDNPGRVDHQVGYQDLTTLNTDTVTI